MSDKIAPVFYVQVQREGTKEAQKIDVSFSIISLNYEDSEKKADLLKLSVDNWDLKNFDDPIWKQGNHVFVSWGYPGNMSPTRECIIQKVTGSTTLNVEAQSKAVLMNKVTKNRVFSNMSRASVVRQIAAENGYGLAINQDIEETNEVFGHITQARATDAQFVKRLADLEGFEFYVDFSGFHWHARRMNQKPLRVMQYYLPPKVGDIITFNVENDIFAKPAAVIVKGRDPINKKNISSTASDKTTSRDTLSQKIELVTIDLIIKSVTHKIQDSNLGSALIKPTTETSPTQVKKEAAGVFTRSTQTTVKLDLNVVGDPGIVAKSVIEIQGISKRLSGLYYVNQANHSVGSNYTLKLKVSTDGTKGHSENIADIGVGGASQTKKDSKGKPNQNDGKKQDDDKGKLVEVVTFDSVSKQITTVWKSFGSVTKNPVSSKKLGRYHGN